jgi:Domain of unknown function (DUF6398)
MANAKSLLVPKGMEALYTELAALTDAFCNAHLGEDYGRLARQALAGLCRKRPSPLLKGKHQTWACGVIYAIGQVNFLSDKANKPHMSMAELCGHFGISTSTGNGKAKIISDALNIQIFDNAWMIPSMQAKNPFTWQVMCNGFIVDARTLPLTVQEHCVARGLIPHVVPPTEDLGSLLVVHRNL